jgi:hypothetical protein
MQVILEKIIKNFGADFENCEWKQNGCLALTVWADSYVQPRHGTGDIGGGAPGVGVHEWLRRGPESGAESATQGHVAQPGGYLLAAWQRDRRAVSAVGKGAPDAEA